MLANRARAVAASSALMLVDTPSMAIVSVKSTRASFWMPSWPAASMIPASSSAVVGMVVDMSAMASDMAANSSSVKSVVFATPVMADSKLMEALDASTKYSATWRTPSMMPAPIRALPRVVKALAPVSPNSWALSAACSCSCRRSSICAASLEELLAKLLVSTPASWRAAPISSSRWVSWRREEEVLSICICLASNRFWREEEKPSVS